MSALMFMRLRRLQRSGDVPVLRLVPKRPPRVRPETVGNAVMVGVLAWCLFCFVCMAGAKFL